MTLELVFQQSVGNDVYHSESSRTALEYRATEQVGGFRLVATRFGCVILKADLTDENLRGADLTGADLTRSNGLTQAQLDQACGINVKLDFSNKEDLIDLHTRPTAASGRLQRFDNGPANGQNRRRADDREFAFLTLWESDAAFPADAEEVAALEEFARDENERLRPLGAPMARSAS